MVQIVNGPGQARSQLWSISVDNGCGIGTLLTPLPRWYPTRTLATTKKPGRRTLTRSPVGARMMSVLPTRGLTRERPVMDDLPPHDESGVDEFCRAAVATPASAGRRGADGLPDRGRRLRSARAAAPREPALGARGADGIRATGAANTPPPRPAAQGRIRQIGTIRLAPPRGCRLPYR